MQIKDKKIKAIRNWPKLKSMKNIKVFLRFANFYYCFIWDFNIIVTSLTLIVKINKLLARLAPILIRIYVNKTVGGDALELILFKFKKLAKLKNLINLFKSPNIIINIWATGFLTFKARIAFIWLKQVFIKAIILQQFNSKYDI